MDQLGDEYVDMVGFTETVEVEVDEVVIKVGIELEV